MSILSALGFQRKSLRVVCNFLGKSKFSVLLCEVGMLANEFLAVLKNETFIDLPVGSHFGSLLLFPIISSFQTAHVKAEVGGQFAIEYLLFVNRSFNVLIVFRLDIVSH